MMKKKQLNNNGSNIENNNGRSNSLKVNELAEKINSSRNTNSNNIEEYNS